MAVPERQELRVGDDERMAVVEQLRVHLGAGRLTLDEFEDRTAQALAARTVGDLVPLTSDLPALRTGPHGPPVRQRPTRSRPLDTWDVLYRVHVAVWAVLVAFFVLIWLFTGAGYFWPGWVILGVGFKIGMHARHTYGRSNAATDIYS